MNDLNIISCIGLVFARKIVKIMGRLSQQYHWKFMKLGYHCQALGFVCHIIFYVDKSISTI